MVTGGMMSFPVSAFLYFCRILGVDEWHHGDRQYDVISCMNLLDRCDKPMTLLRNIRQVLKSNTGILLLAVVVPYKPYVEFGK